MAVVAVVVMSPCYLLGAMQEEGGVKSPAGGVAEVCGATGGGVRHSWRHP